MIRWMTTLMLAGLLTPGLLMAQNEAADAAKADADKKADAQPVINFEFRPSNVQLSTSVNFDQEGRINNSNSSLSIGFRVKYDSNAQPVVVRNIQATSVVTDARETLTGNSRGYEQTLFAWENSSNRNERQEFHLHMSFSAPKRPAKSIRQISGTMEVVCASGEPAEAVLKPFSDYEGKRITFKDMPGMFITFSREERGNQKQTKVEMPTQFKPHIARIMFYDNAGRELNYRGWGGGSNNNTEYRNLNIDMPADGQVRVQLYPVVESRLVPFEVLDIPLGPEEKETAGDVMVELKPIAPVDGELKLQRLDPVVEQ